MRLMQHLPIVNKDGHRPIPAGDTLDASSMPISTKVGNQLNVAENGLYVGVLNEVPVEIYVNTATGIDDNTRGTQAQPLKTLDYAFTLLHQREGMFRVGSLYRVLLQVGQTFELTKNVEMRGITLQICFYGEPRGAWNSAYNQTTLEVLEDINRPVIKNKIVMNNATGRMEASRFFTKNPKWPCQVEFHGIRLDIDDLLSTNAGVVHLVDGMDVVLVGSIVNKIGVTQSGLLAIRANAEAKITQFASQFRIGDVLLDRLPGPGEDSTPELEARKNFIKFYRDHGGNTYQWDQLLLNPETLNSSDGSGILHILWTDTPRQPSGSSYSLKTFPVHTDINFGLLRYLDGLRMDQQSRPINVISGRALR